MKVFVIDDSPLVRGRLHELLAEIPGLSLVAQLDQASDLKQAIEAAGPDVVILNIQRLNARGIEILEELKFSELPLVKIMLTAFPNPLYRQHCLEAGAHFFLDRAMEFERIVDVLNSLTAHLNTQAKI